MTGNDRPPGWQTHQEQGIDSQEPRRQQYCVETVNYHTRSAAGVEGEPQSEGSTAGRCEGGRTPHTAKTLPETTGTVDAPHSRPDAAEETQARRAAGLRASPGRRAAG